ncbi:MAG: hypothetical protein Fur0022_11310 [Anaerolineales bacterium]
MSKKYINSFRSQSSDKEKGQSLLEMAFATIILLLLLAGIVDLGRLFFTYIALRDAAQEGAAFAAICPPNSLDNKASISDRVKASSHFPVDLSSPNVFVNSSFSSSPTPGSPVLVIVYYNNFQFIMPFLNLVNGTLSASAQDISLQWECPTD